MIVISTIIVLAGVNGSGKSSIGGVLLRKTGANYFNPDEEAREIIKENPQMAIAKANELAWKRGKSLLEDAIANRLETYIFETTLGGNTITKLLEQAIDRGCNVQIWYVGLASPELCINRVNGRVKAGGHAIPEADIRRRYNKSLLNLIRLLPKLSRLSVFDNSEQVDAVEKKASIPCHVLEMKYGQIVSLCPLSTAPEWAKPILLAALNLTKK